VRVLLLGLLVGCYSPKIQPGAPCPDGVCPSELVCTHAGTCELTDSDAPPGGDAPLPADAPIALDGRPADASGPPADAGPFCYGTGLVRICFPTMPQGALQLPATIDTGGSTCSGVSATYCVLAGKTIGVAGTVKATGPRPLVLVATDAISIPAGAVLDVSAVGTSAGPGGRSACTSSAPTGDSGGAGGTFGSRGGDGGSGPLSGVATPAAAVTPITSLVGGCSGETGAGAMPGGGGGGGGAVYLIANQLQISGTIDASGEGGNGATVTAGGGGGGAGGFIGLDGASLALDGAAKLFANGGGGGEAAGSTAAGNGGGDPTAPDVRAQGGTGSSPNGGDGGDGAFAATGAEPGFDATSPTAGGGGGGGGVGAIRGYGVTITPGANISPPPT